MNVPAGGGAVRAVFALRSVVSGAKVVSVVVAELGFGGGSAVLGHALEPLRHLLFGFVQDFDEIFQNRFVLFVDVRHSVTVIAHATGAPDSVLHTHHTTHNRDQGSSEQWRERGVKQSVE